MKTFKKILLHIPHSSNARSTELWSNPIAFDKTCVRKYTDWHTDIIFASPRPEVESVVFPYSRFYIDVERLENDPLEKKGQGILYTRYKGNGETFTRVVPEDQRAYMLELYKAHHRKLSEAVEDDTLVIDCHSFPSELSDVDVCIGLNDDETRPDDIFVEAVVKIFSDWGYKVAINTPYSNSIAPKTDKSYKSMMIELNKRIYLNEYSLDLRPERISSIKEVIQEVYSLALGATDTLLEAQIYTGCGYEKPFEIGDRIVIDKKSGTEGQVVLVLYCPFQLKGKPYTEVTYLLEVQGHIIGMNHDDILPYE